MEHLEHPMLGAAAPYPQAYVISIRTGRGGRWEYSPWFQAPALHAAAQVRLTGRRTQDYLRAERAANQQHQRRVTVWHHVFDFNAVNDTCTMQLVNWRNHTGTIPHAGGCVQYAEAHGRPYRAVPMAPEDLRETLDGLTALAPLQHSARELSAFTLSTGKELSSELRQLLLGQRTVSKEGLMTLASKHDLCLDALLPLTDSPECANITDVMARFGRCKLTLSATPLFIDPYGNEVWVAEDRTMYLCDHETNTLELIDQDLREILE